MKKKFIATKQFVHRHKTGLAVAATAITATYLHVKTIENVNNRLVEMGINLDEFYTTEED